MELYKDEKTKIGAKADTEIGKLLRKNLELVSYGKWIKDLAKSETLATVTDCEKNVTEQSNFSFKVWTKTKIRLVTHFPYLSIKNGNKIR